MSNRFPSVRPRRLRQNESLRSIFQETEFRLEDLILPIFVEEGIDDFVPITSMPGVNRIPEKLLAQEIERYARAGIKSVMTFGVSHHLDEVGSDTWNENGLVARMARICKDTVPEMVVMSDTCFCEYTSHGHCGVLHDHGVDNDATLANLGKQAVIAADQRSGRQGRSDMKHRASFFHFADHTCLNVIGLGGGPGAIFSWRKTGA